MPSNTITRDHHNLRRNLNLNDKYISNDGGDEGLRITDAGLVGIGVADPDTQLEIFGTSTHLKLSYDANEYATMAVEDDATLTIKTTSAGTVDDIILDPGRYIYLYKNGSVHANINYIGSATKLTATLGDLELVTSATDKDITINPKRHVIIESNGGTFTPSADGHVATKKYVDDEISGSGGSARSVAGDTDNALISWVTSDNTFAAEANLTFDGTDLLVASTGKLAVGDTATYLHQASDSNLALVADGDISLSATGDVNIPTSVGLTFGDDGEKIEGDGTDLTITSSRHLALVTGTDAGSIYLDSGTGIFHFRDEQDSNDNFKITVAKDTGATTLETVSDAADGHLSIVADGHVEFDNCAVGFDKLAGTFGTASVTSNPNDSTDIDFRLSNKYELELTDNMDAPPGGEILALIFPNTSGNFILTLIQDGTGSRTVHADSWKAHAHDGTTCDNLAGADGGDGLIRWAGGSAPTLTTTADKTDIISVYWDADNQTAFAVASLNF